ncbi:hypothetical protein FQN54_006597 [Arachnomyces sp. PD_36]|nr:hypothetical protein FQN54_006597 [Arachnomyces sp. PD_36]
MDSSNPIIFYDIASAPPVVCFAPNPFKTRYALNFKGIPYKTEWVELPNVTKVRKSLGAAANRTHRDGSPFYTLPIIKNPTTGEVVGDSFDIALYLDNLKPDGPSLFPPTTVSLQAAFNVQVDAIFTNYVRLFVHGLPFNPETAEESKATFVQRAGAKSWDELTVTGKEREENLQGLKAALEPIAKLYKLRDGLFLEGDTPIYADMILGSWLECYKVTLKEWDVVQTWHGGLWGKIHQGLQKYAEMR